MFRTELTCLVALPPKAPAPAPASPAAARSKSEAGGGRHRSIVFLATLVSSTLLHLVTASKGNPVFLEPISNVTVPAGREVKLACVVDNLASYKLAWIQRDRSAILTVGQHVITRNNRIGVSHDGHRTWYLNIRDVKPADAGTYMCQINTEVAISQTGHVDVVVPPYIKDDMSSRDVRLLEGNSVTLACSARGSPVPTIKWRREDNANISLNLTTSMLEVPGPLLHLPQVTRTDMAAYLCIASNGIPPSVSKRIQVEVKFVPTVYVPHQLVGVPLGQDVTIECYIEAWPTGLNYWKRPNGIQVLHNDRKYKVKQVEGSQRYKTHLLLTIMNVTRHDTGEYNCIANNSQGGAQQAVRVSVSQPIPLHTNTISKGYEGKDTIQGKPSLPAVSWAKDTDSASSVKDELADLRKVSHHHHANYNNHQEPSTKRINEINVNEDFPPPSSSSSTSSASASRRSNSLCIFVSFLLFLRGVQERHCAKSSWIVILL
ncbi:lachesin-like isoform X2 [Macrobrachium nipponense]|uniref:lachesin-like isoform X2 n=1 Tax=Macrobrachium nipponense TaxID=159736 RepID=UPI0030C8AF21